MKPTIQTELQVGLQLHICNTNNPPNCHWFVFDTVKKECKFYIRDGVFHEVLDKKTIVGPRHGNPLWTSDEPAMTFYEPTVKTSR